MAVAGARPAVVCDTGRVVDSPADRAAVAGRSGAEAVDMESAALAASGRLVGVVRAIIDTPSERVGRLAFAAKPDGRTDLRAAAIAFLTEPVMSVRVARRASTAFGALEAAARAIRALEPR